MQKYERDRLYWRFGFLFILSILAWGIFLIIP
jgi:hypothetical protein